MILSILVSSSDNLLFISGDIAWPGAPGAPPMSNAGLQNVETKVSTVEAKVQALEVKIDKIMNHFGVK